MSTRIATLREEFLTQIPNIIVIALALVAAINWNDAFQSLLNYYLPNSLQTSSNPWAKVSYALIITLIAVFLIVLVIYAAKNVKEAMLPRISLGV